MNKNIDLYIYHHLGLGDHIICNAIVRNIRKQFDNNLFIFCKPIYGDSVRFMFRDIDITVLEKTGEEVEKFIKTLSSEQLIKIGHEHLFPFSADGATFDIAFYRQIGLNFNRRWTDFYVERDYTREKALYEKLITNENYIFVHDDITRNFIIPENLLPKNINVIRPKPEDTTIIFDYCTIIENAKEIHVMDSSFKHIIDTLPIKTNLLTYHTYIRGKGQYNVSQSNKLWKII